MPRGFLSSMYGHVLYLITSSGVAFLLWVVDRILNWKLPRWVYVAIVGAGLVYASFSAWQDAHERAGTLVTENARLQNALNDRTRAELRQAQAEQRATAERQQSEAAQRGLASRARLAEATAASLIG